MPTDKTVSAAIDKVMAGPSAGDYYASAVYYLKEGKDIGKAKMWIDKALSMMETPRFWHLRQKSLIYAKENRASPNFFVHLFPHFFSIRFNNRNSCRSGI
mgnify:CR=1 FL=1